MYYIVIYLMYILHWLERVQAVSEMNKKTQPVKNRKKVNEILTYLRGKNERDYMIAKTQLNTALRISDVLKFKVNDFLLENGNFRISLNLEEKKTKKNKLIALNDTLLDSMRQYIANNNLTPDDYLFRSRKGANKPISTTQAHRIFYDVAQALHLENFGTHSLRKTWGYFCYMETKNIALIMEVYNHASEKITLRYIGITQNDIDKMYFNIQF